MDFQTGLHIVIAVSCKFWLVDIQIYSLVEPCKPRTLIGNEGYVFWGFIR